MATAHWKLISPKKGKERETLFTNCGRGCFLLPAKRKFPICRKCGPTGKCACAPDCKGLRAAVIRGRQWGYVDVADKARRMHDDLGCKWPGFKKKTRKNGK